MLIKSKGSNFTPPLGNLNNDQNINDIAYEDLDNYELLNTYWCTSISELDDKNVLRRQFDSKTNTIIGEIHVTENEIIDDIHILDPNKVTRSEKISHKMFIIYHRK